MLNAVHGSGAVEGPILGAVCNYFNCKCSVGQDVIMEAEFLASEYDPSAPIDVTSDISGGTDVFKGAVESDGEVIDWNDVEVTISGTSADTVTDVEFKIDNKASERHRLRGTSTPAEVMWGPADITGKVTIDLENNTELTRMLDKSSFALAVKIGAFTWTFSGCEWETSTIDQDCENPVQQVLPFRATSVAIA
jgi:hypothetical protein